MMNVQDALVSNDEGPLTEADRICPTRSGCRVGEETGGSRGKSSRRIDCKGVVVSSRRADNVRQLASRCKVLKRSITRFLAAHIDPVVCLSVFQHNYQVTAWIRAWLMRSVLMYYYVCRQRRSGQPRRLNTPRV